MGIDIHGWVEFRRGRYVHTLGERWRAVIKIDDLIERNYDPFGCLFGIANRAHFRPIAAGRGVPPDLSEEAQNDFEEWYTGGGRAYGQTWISWSELKAINWDEWAEEKDSRVHEYVRDATGDLVRRGSALWTKPLGDYLGWRSIDIPHSFPEGSEWEVDDVVYRIERLRRRDALTESWRLLFVLMEKIAEHYGDDGVRLVVWFDG